MNSRSGFALAPVVIILTGVVAVGAIVYFFISSGSAGKIGGTALWKTYQNAQYGFAFKYDPKWQSFEPKDPNDDRLLTLSPRPGLGPIAAGVDEFTVSVVETPIEERKNEAATFSLDVTYEATQVGGRKAYISNVQQGIEGRFREVLIDLDGRTLVILASGKHLTTLPTLLGTIRFTERNVACTLEAKLCPDGSYVSRIPPNCEFAPCPTANATNGNANSTNVNTNATNSTANINVNQNTNAAVSNKFCNVDGDCGLLICGGCFSKTYLKSASPDLPCRTYEGYSCICQSNTCTPVKGSSSDLRVTLLDASTQQPMADVVVLLYVDNGVRCVTEPCPTYNRTWSGKTDTQGNIVVPAAYVDASMIVAVSGYPKAELHLSGKLQGDGSWILSLTKPPDDRTLNEE